MKTKNLITIIALGCLFGCQQNEQSEQNSAIINFSMSIDNDNLETALTRSGVSNFYAGKTSFTTGEVISMATANSNYTPFAIGKDIRTWNEIETNKKEVEFYAHYPELPCQQSQCERRINGGKELLFGMAKAVIETSNIALQFKRMTVPVIVVDESGKLYDGDATVKLHVKNQGIQNLREGNIEIDTSSQEEEIEISKTPSSISNLLPQRISMGSNIATISVGGKKETFKARSNISLNAGNTLVVTVIRKKDGNYNVIIDGDVPLRR